MTAYALVGLQTMSKVFSQYSRKSIVFYIIFGSDGSPINSKYPASDSTVGFTSAHLIPPPSNAASIIRHIVTREGLPASEVKSAKLYIDGDAEAELESTKRVSLAAGSGIASSRGKPMVLILGGDVASTPATDAAPEPTSVPKPEPAAAPQRAPSPPPQANPGWPPAPPGWVTIVRTTSYSGQPGE